MTCPGIQSRVEEEEMALDDYGILKLLSLTCNLLICISFTTHAPDFDW